jgi:hypothetical protein
MFDYSQLDSISNTNSVNNAKQEYHKSVISLINTLLTQYELYLLPLSQVGTLESIELVCHLSKAIKCFSALNSSNKIISYENLCHNNSNSNSYSNITNLVDKELFNNMYAFTTLISTRNTTDKRLTTLSCNDQTLYTSTSISDVLLYDAENIQLNFTNIYFDICQNEICQSQMQLDIRFIINFIQYISMKCNTDMYEQRTILEFQIEKLITNQNQYHKFDYDTTLCIYEQLKKANL